MIVKSRIPGTPSSDPIAIFTHPSWWGTHTKITTWRPLTTLSFAANYALGGVDPRGYHVVNVGLHAGRVRWRIFSSPRSGCATPQDPASCEVSIPASGYALFRVRRALYKCVKGQLAMRSDRE